jgi:hypothetical protein
MNNLTLSSWGFVFEVVRISSTQSVIARPCFLRSWQSHESSFIICRIKNCGIEMNEILILSDKNATLFRMTNWLNEIATSLNQRTVGLLAMTDLDNYFHSHLVLQNSMKIYSVNIVKSEKGLKQNKIKAHPPESPLNGGINSTIPLLGGVPFYGGEGAFNRSSFDFF